MQKWKLFPALLSCLLLTACAAPEEPKNPSVPETAVLGEAAGVPEDSRAAAPPPIQLLISCATPR